MNTARTAEIDSIERALVDTNTPANDEHRIGWTIGRLEAHGDFMAVAILRLADTSPELKRAALNWIQMRGVAA